MVRINRDGSALQTGMSGWLEEFLRLAKYFNNLQLGVYEQVGVGCWRERSDLFSTPTLAWYVQVS